MEMENILIIRLPLPISTNALYANNWRGSGKGRYKTTEYKDWLKRADSLLMTQKWAPIVFAGELDIYIKVTKNTRCDVDNLIKCVLDFLVSRGITGDDRHHRKVSIEKADIVDCEVEIVA